MTDEKKYPFDVFISYRWVEPDQTWVRDQLGPALENAGLKVLLDVDDFVPGRNLIKEMTRGSTESRRGLCIISPDYFSDVDRPVDFESLMLVSLDFSGSSSRLIPIIIRKTDDVPLYIKNLIPVDWTNPAWHAREWSKLLSVLEATNLEVPPPPPLPDNTGPAPPKTVLVPPKSPPKPPRRISKPVLLGVVGLVLFLGLLAVGYKACQRPVTKKVDGHVYYQKESGSTALIAVEGVEVYLSNSELHSGATKADGKFVLEGIPASASIDLKAKYGNVFYPMGFETSGTYAVIPRDPVPSARKFISTPWSEASQERCLPDDGRQATNAKVYKNDIQFEGESGKREAALTVELVQAPETEIKAADVVETPGGSYKTQSVRDSTKSRVWLFDLSNSGSTTHLIVCLGSNDGAAEISSGKLLTYYSLQ